MKSIDKETQHLIDVAKAALEKAAKRGDLGMVARLIREQRHTLKFAMRLKKK